MTSSLRLEMSFGGRWLLRDNWLCDGMAGSLRRRETMAARDIEAVVSASHR